MSNTATITSPADLIGRTVQYRKVGTFRVVALVTPWTSDLSAEFHAANPDRAKYGGWFALEPIKVPKAYREGGKHYGAHFWISDTDVVAS